MITILPVPESLLAIAVIPFKLYTSLAGIRQYVNVNLVCISMTTIALEHLLIYLSAVWICPCELQIYILHLFLYCLFCQIVKAEYIVINPYLIHHLLCRYLLQI